jgi:tetratricopeptide (TPR) repeat protein
VQALGFIPRLGSSSVRNFSELRKREQEIKRELEQDNLRLTHEREQLLEKLSWYSEHEAWVGFDSSIGAHSDAVVIRQFERFCSSSNEQVRALCNRKRIKFFEDKHRLKEFIDYATIEVKQGRATPNLYNKLGVAIWLSHGSLLDAQNYFEKALKHPALKDRDLKRNITYNLATVLGHQGQYTKAVNYLTEAEKSFTLDPAGRVLRAALRSRESQALVCKDLRLACGNDGNKRFCDNWERAKEIGDCSETVTPLDEDILQSITHSD